MKYCLAFVMAATLMGGPIAAPAQSKNVVAFAASSLKNALDEIAAQWHAETGKRVDISYAASGTLIKQIEHGAPADVFISSDPDWMDYGQQKNLIKPETRLNLLGNQIVLIGPRDSNIELTIQPGLNLASLLRGEQLAMGNVDAVPAGEYGKFALERLGCWESVKDHVVQTEDVTRRTAFGIARCGSTWYRLPDRRLIRSVGQNCWSISGRHPSSNYLPNCPDQQANQCGRTAILRLCEVAIGPPPIRAPRLYHTCTAKPMKSGP